MNTKELMTLIFFIVILGLYIYYIILKRKEESEEESNMNKLISVLKEYSEKQPDLAKIMNKFGLF
jgi:preprotein translocase subunit YajC